ncbi:MAG TPA: GntR family transcriptional regulator [Alphaproteobacteria bacterium]|nr:GntR family transcriptional regulator [Alphaproteobacteria bacterium]
MSEAITSGREKGVLEAEGPPVGELHAPLRDLVVDRLRANILSGRYKSGERLVEDRLAEDFKVSRNPVREAIRALAAEGLVAVTPRRGATVAGFSTAETREMIEVRATLEAMNARLAARRRDPGMIATLMNCLNEGQQRAGEGDPAELVRLNAHFHDLLAAAGHNRILGDLMRKLRERTNLVFAPRSANGAAQTWEEHRAILEAVIVGDEELAALLASRHVLQAGERHLEATEAAAGGEAGPMASAVMLEAAETPSP